MKCYLPQIIVFPKSLFSSAFHGLKDHHRIKLSQMTSHSPGTATDLHSFKRQLNSNTGKILITLFKLILSICFLVFFSISLSSQDKCKGLKSQTLKMFSDFSNISKEQQNYWFSQTCINSIGPIFW